MKVFISWSGERSKALATALYSWLPVVIQSIEPWMSRESIGAGQRWNTEIAESLDVAQFGIVCVTRENRDAPWLLFEAGALAKQLNTRVVPILLGLDARDVEHPIGQFQLKKAERDGIFELLESMNQVSETPLSPERLQQAFAGQWLNLENSLAAIPAAPPSAKPVRSSDEILEELVNTVRGIDLSIGSLEDKILSVELFQGLRPSLTPQPQSLEVGDGLHDFLSEMMAGSLTPKQRDVIRLLYGLDDGKKRSYNQVAQLFGTTAIEIKKIETAALRAIRQPRKDDSE